MKEVFKGKKFWIISGSILGALVVVFVGFGIYFQSHFFFRSSINGVSSSAATPAAMHQRLSHEAEGYTLTLLEADGKKEELSVSDLGMRVDIEESTIQNLLNEQNGFLWVYYLCTGKEYFEEELVSCDLKTIEKSVEKLACVKNSSPIETKNANVTYKNGEFEIVDEVYGTEIDAKSFAKKIQRAGLSLKRELNLKEEKCYKQPKYKADDKEVKGLQKTLNQYVSTNITYDIGGTKENLSKDRIGSWLSGDDKMQPAFDEEGIAKFVSEMSAKYDTYGKPKQLMTQAGVTVTVPGGNYGWRIDKAKEAAQLKKDIAGGKNVSRDFEYQFKAASRGDNDYGNSYVEINKTAQRVYLIVNGSCVLDTPCVTGKEDGEHQTPVGAYRITYCQKNATLRGPGYVTPVAYWMPFNGDIGLHDATWQKSFGGQRYREGYGSHGCVNLPISAAGTIFSNVSTGFPVLMYYMAGTETVDTLTKQHAQSCMDAINAIGGVTTGSADVINAARGAYEALSDSGKGCVTNYQTLVDAEVAYANAVAEADRLAKEEEEKKKLEEEQKKNETIKPEENNPNVNLGE